MAETREYKSREVARSPIYVILHSLLEVSFCTQPFPRGDHANLDRSCIYMKILY